ncbi:MAG: 5'-3' exonuclease H3TH domain-containing protein, partial [Myxococcota bacterium]
MATTTINGFPQDDTLFLIDGQGYIYRAYYAIRRLSTADGRATNAVYGFTTMLLKVLREHAPKHLGIAFDLGGQNFRHRLYPEYKANRSAPPDDLPPQLPLIHDVVSAFRIPMLAQRGWEADDLIGTVAREATERGMKVVIVTGDKDFMQLVSDDVCLLDEMRQQRGKEGSVVSFDEVRAKFGVAPERVIDVLALAGDASDNIPGVKGIGEKTASQLVEEFGDLEAVLSAASSMKQQKRRENLLDGAEAARLAKQLVTIDTHADFSVLPDSLRYEGPDRARLRQLFEELEFRRLLDEQIVRDEPLPLTPPAVPTASAAPSAAVAAPRRKPETLSLFASSGTIEKRGVDDEIAAQAVDRTRYLEVTTEEDLERLVSTLEGQSIIGLQVMTEEDRSLLGELTGLAVAWAPGEAAYVPLRHD